MCWLDCLSLNWVELGGGAHQDWWGEASVRPEQMAEPSSGLGSRWGRGRSGCLTRTSAS